MNVSGNPGRTNSGNPSRRKRVFAIVPSLLTLGNAVCGFGAITYAAKLGPEQAPIVATAEIGGVKVGIDRPTNDLYIAALLVFGAMVFDALDGPVARLSKQTSNFGAQLDSLCDAISFGVAPAFLMLKSSRVFHPRLLWVIAVLYMLCALLRLARFNVHKTDPNAESDFFAGLPSPAAAGMVASLVVVVPSLQRWTEPELSDRAQQFGQWITSFTAISLPIVTLFAACLMVSRVRYPHLFNQLFRGRRSFQHLVKLIFALVAVFAVHELAIPLIFSYYVLAAPLQLLGTRAIGLSRRSPVPPSTPVGPN